MITCGLWGAPRDLVAVVIDDEEAPSKAIKVARTDDARWGLLEFLDAHHGIECELVIPEVLLRTDSIAHLARKRGRTVWVIPQSLADAVRTASSRNLPPRRSAAMIARLPTIPLFRPHLRRLTGPLHNNQLDLL
jgi:uncharacterized protein YbjT (DUF2867 family)